MEQCGVLRAKHEAHSNVSTGSHLTRDEIFTSEQQSIEKPVLAGRIRLKLQRIESISNTTAFDVSEDEADDLLETKHEIYVTAMTTSDQTQDEIFTTLVQLLQKPALASKVRVIGQRVKSTMNSAAFKQFMSSRLYDRLSPGLLPSKGGARPGHLVEGDKFWSVCTSVLLIVAVPLLLLLKAAVILFTAISYVNRLRTSGRSIQSLVRKTKGRKDLQIVFLSLNIIMTVVSVHGIPNQMNFENNENCTSTTTSVYCKGLSGNFLPRHCNENVHVLFVTDSDMTSLSEDNFRQIENVSTLYISHCTISIKRDNNILFSLKKLENLEISNSHVSDEIFNMLGNTSNLVQLTLQGNHITRLKNGSFGGLPNLQRIDLSHNSISEIEAGAFVGLAHLQELLLSHNRLYKGFDPDLVHLQGRCVLCLEQKPVALLRCPPPSPLDVLWGELSGARVLNLEGDPICERVGDAPLADLQRPCDEDSDCCAHERRRRFLQGACRREGDAVTTAGDGDEGDGAGGDGTSGAGGAGRDGGEGDGGVNDGGVGDGADGSLSDRVVHHAAVPGLVVPLLLVALVVTVGFGIAARVVWRRRPPGAVDERGGGGSGSCPGAPPGQSSEGVALLEVKTETRSCPLAVEVV